MLKIDESKNTIFNYEFFDIRGRRVKTYSDITTREVIIEKDNLSSGFIF